MGWNTASSFEEIGVLKRAGTQPRQWVIDSSFCSSGQLRNPCASVYGLVRPRGMVHDTGTATLQEVMAPSRIAINLFKQFVPRQGEQAVVVIS